MINKTDQITTLSFFRYATRKDKSWAFGMMRKGPSYLSSVKGMEFFKLMGSGSKLGSPAPDWSVYALLQVWENEEAALEFIKTSELMEKFSQRTAEQVTFFLKCLVAHGKWSNKEPFLINPDINNDLPLAVITRATIRAKQLIKFWKQAKKSQQPFINAPGLLYSKGIGEVPLSQMATFSIWDNLESMMNTAYKNQDHQNAIKMTRQLNWYSEELFSRFSLYKVSGSWNEVSDQLAALGVATASIMP